MQVILLERVENLGQMGDLVTVKPGYARNFLLPRKKALRSTKENVEYFNQQKKQLEADNLKKKEEAEKVAKELEGKSFVLVRQASDSGQLYGSVNTRDISLEITDKGFSIHKNQVQLNHSIKQLGLFYLDVSLHPEVKSRVIINVAKSMEEAETQQKLYEKGLEEGKSIEEISRSFFMKTEEEPSVEKKETVKANKAEDKTEETTSDVVEETVVEASAEETKE